VQFGSLGLIAFCRAFLLTMYFNDLNDFTRYRFRGKVIVFPTFRTPVKLTDNRFSGTAPSPNPILTG